MPLLHFMPWCHLERNYRVGDISLVQFFRDRPVPGLDALSTAHARLILGAYKSASGLPISHAVLVQYKDRPVLDDLTPDEATECVELSQLAAFAGLADREYFKQMGNYCNADCFAIHGQRFRDEPLSTALGSRRVDGGHLVGIRMSELCITAPPQVNRQAVKLDETLAGALAAHRSSAPAEEWARWQNAIACFNRANSDDSSSMFQVEWVLLCSAFEHLLDADSRADDVAQKFVDATPDIRSMPAIRASRKIERWRDEGHSLRFEWLREFYRIRGDFAHGRLDTRQPCAWRAQDHLLLAAIAFPLLVRSLLKRAGRYQLTERDEQQLWAFEAAADGDCFNEIENPESCDPFLWPKLLADARSEQQARRIQTRIEEALKRDEAKPNG